MSNNLEKLVTPKEVAELLAFRRSKVHRMLATGEIPRVIVAQGARRRVFRVKPSALRKWIADREVAR